MDTQVTVFSCDNCFPCLHLEQRNKTLHGSQSGERSGGKFSYLCASLRKSEDKTFINHGENPLLPHCLGASPVLNYLFGAGYSEPPKVAPHDWSDPPWHYLLKAGSLQHGPLPSRPPYSPLTLECFFLEAESLLLWQDFTTQTFLFSTSFHNADWK